MRKLTGVILLLCIFLIFAIVACTKPAYEKLKPSSSVEDVADSADDNVSISVIEPVTEKDNVTEGQPVSKLKEGCFYDKELSNFTKAGIMFYYVAFLDKSGKEVYNFTSKSNVSIDKLFDNDVGICIYNDRWQFFDREDKIWSFR